MIAAIFPNSAVTPPLLASPYLRGDRRAAGRARDAHRYAGQPR